MFSKDSDIQWNIALAIALFAIGLVAGVLFKTKVHNLAYENYQLHEINMQLINDLEVLRGCVPAKNSKALLSRVDDKLFCEIHTKRTKL